MPAFSGYRYTQIQQALSELFERCLWHYTESVVLTHDDMLRLFVKPEHQAIVRDIQKIADIDFNNGTASIFAESDHGPIQVYLNMQQKGELKPFVMPRYAADGPVEAPPEEVTTKLTRFANLRGQISIDFGHMHMLVDWLQTHCATPMQARFVCPSLVGLIALSEDGKDLADQLRPFRLPSALPRLPRGLAEYAKQIDARIARAMLLPKPETKAHDMEVVMLTQQLSSGPPPWNQKMTGVRM